jgi:hypothetical protein
MFKKMLADEEFQPATLSAEACPAALHPQQLLERKR